MKKKLGAAVAVLMARCPRGAWELLRALASGFFIVLLMSGVYGLFVLFWRWGLTVPALGWILKALIIAFGLGVCVYAVVLCAYIVVFVFEWLCERLYEDGKFKIENLFELIREHIWLPGLAVVLLFAIRLSPGVYQIPAVHAVARAVLTNAIPTAPYRGAGRPEATFLIEQLMDRAARVLGVDPVEIRRRNFIPASAMPHKVQTGITYDSGDFVHVMDECLKLADWNGFAKRAAASKKDGRLRGRGLAYFLEEAAVFNDRMVLRFDPSGMLTILAGTHSHGQGHETVYAQMAAEWLGVPFGNIRFVQGDTDAVPFGRGTYGSRSMQVGGNALKKAADNIIEKAKPMAAMMLEAAAGDLEFKDGSFRIVGTDRALPLTNVAKAFYRPAMLPPQFDVGLEASGTFAAEPPNYPNGCHVCEVEIDPQTGTVTLARYAAVDDVGKVMNRLLCEGQIHGGVAQGTGQALMEAIIFDSAGQLVTGSFQDYAMPRAEDFPDLLSELTEVPAKTNPLGVKGAGEAGATGAPPAIISAILDALKPLGIQHIDMPATPARVWAAINARATAKAAE